METHGKSGRIIVGGIFFLAHTLLVGCEDAPPPPAPPTRPSSEADGGNVMGQRQAGVMTELQETGADEYRIVKEYPSHVTGVVVKRQDGSQEILPEGRVQSLMEGTQKEGLLGMGTVLAGGLLGYMMGKSAAPNPFVYQNDALYQQSLARWNQLEERKKDEQERGTWRGYWYGGRTYYPGSYRTGGASASPTAKTGFFSRMTSSFRGFMG